MLANTQRPVQLSFVLSTLQHLIMASRSASWIQDSPVHPCDRFRLHISALQIGPLESEVARTGADHSDEFNCAAGISGHVQQMAYTDTPAAARCKIYDHRGALCHDGHGLELSGSTLLLLDVLESL